MNSTYFSIIMPVYNTKESFLIEAIDSVLNINYKNYEFIIVDDGSNDSTKNILNKYVDKARIIHQDNKGISGSRLTGLSIASGDYIVFVDSDDVIHKESLNVLNSIIVEHSPEVIMFDPPRFKYDINVEEFRNRFFDEGCVTKKEALEQLCKLHLNGIGDKFIKKHLYDDMASHIDQSIINGEDLQQSTYIVLKANTFYYTDFPIEYYRLNLEKREYYNATKINDINFTVPTYNMLFKQNNEYDYLLPTYKQSAINSVIYNAFKICKVNIPYKQKVEILNSLNKQEVVKILKQIESKIPLVSSFLFYLLINKHYVLLIIAATVYKQIYGLDNLY